MTELSDSAADAPGKRAGAATYIVRTLIIIAALVVVVMIGRFVRGRLLSTDKLFELTEAALREEPQPDLEAVEAYLLRILAREPESNRANLMMAGLLTRTERIDQALEYATRIEDNGSLEAVRARCLTGELLLQHRRQPSAALAQFERAYQQDPSDATANGFLAYLNLVGLRTRTMLPYSLFLAKNGLLSPQQLFELSLGHEARANPGLVDAYARTAPDDPIRLIGQADLAREHGDYDHAEDLYRRITREHAEFLAAHVRLGQVFLDAGNAEGFYEWDSGLPADAEQHPLTWSIRGGWAEQLENTDVAIRCYWESVRIDPNHLPALYRLGQLLVGESRVEDAMPFLHRADLLEVYSQQIRSLILLTDREQPDADGFLMAAMMAGDLGLMPEANAWISLVLQVSPDDETAQQAERSLRELLPEDPRQRAVDDANPAQNLDLSEFPLPDWTSEGGAEVSKPPVAAPTAASFENQAADAGLDFQFFKGGDPDVLGLAHIWSANGGGVAVLDLDCDGWPDIHLTQGTDPNQQPPQHFDQLYRNIAGDRVSDVTSPARIVEDRYSQGATVGDFNADGFPDLRVANIGGNRLYQNNGDGTFTDVSDVAEVAGMSWTTSCLLADLNGDGLSDLYDVNYLSGTEPIATICRNAEGRRHACHPLQFQPSQDELFVNRGDGSFTNVTEDCGILAFNGRGLGMVAGDFDGSGKLNLFIANVAAANFYFVNETEDSAGIPKFTEQALQLGAAYGRQGHVQTGGGVAAGDVDHDGQLELFVTSGWDEPAALYDWQPQQQFQENAMYADLAGSGRISYGFGTQFIDGALRGSLDLVVANGHVDKSDLPEIPYAMPPQYFSNHGNGRFAGPDVATPGPYFDGEYLGRALARVDWNGDGREDVVVTHLDAPAALLTNTTENAGSYIAVRLVGVQSAREAIGTTLTLTTDDGRTLTRQLTAGDGFQASNQRIVVFGLGDATGTGVLRIRWPSGIEQQFTDVNADQRYVCVEGMDRLYHDAR